MHGDAGAQNAAFSPDGDRIVFTFFTNAYNKGPAELWIASSSEYPTDGQRLPLRNIVAFFVSDTDAGEDVPVPTLCRLRFA
ncbi:MAG: hypothetical protein ACYTFA_14885 [Planctomycetota bacterium]